MENIKTVEELYIQASNAKDLRVDPEHKRLVDVLIAAGMTPGILGHALMRLQSEYDSTAKRFHSITETEARLLYNSLKSLPKVIEGVAAWAASRGHDRPHELAGEAVAFWLDDNCQRCKGRGYSMIRGTPVLGKPCPHCKGIGKRQPPAGQVGRAALNMMDMCVINARHSMKNRLRAYR